MRRIIEQIRSRCEALLEGCDDLILVVRAGQSEHLALMSTLGSIENEGSRHAFWLFPEPFETKAAYAETLCGAFRSRLEAMNAALTQDEEPTLPPLPAQALDSAVDPVERLRSLMVFARSLIEDLEAVHLVWGFLPTEIHEPGAYATLMAELLAHQPPIPWCHHMRVIVRELGDPAPLHEHGRALPRATWFTPDLGSAAMEKALDDEVGDASLPLARRMQALFVLAGFDIAHQRFQPAAEKYGLLAKYYHGTGELPLCALSLNGLGEVAGRNHRPDLAQQSFERALTPAIASRSLPALINITLNLANLHRGQKRWSEAFEHYRAVSTLAKAVSSTPLEIRCLEQMGFCRYKLDDKKGAWEQWTAGKELAKKFKVRAELMGCLERLRELFSELGMKAQRKEVEQEIGELQAHGAGATPA